MSSSKFFSSFFLAGRGTKRIFRICGSFKQLSVHSQFIGNTVIFSGKKAENTKVATIISDVFWDLKIALRKINDATIVVASVDKIFNNIPLAAFTNHVIENYNFLVVSGQHLKRNNIVGALDNNIASHRIDPFVKIINHVLVLVLMKVFCVKVNFFVGQQLVKHMQKNISFTRVARPTNKHPKGICWHTRVPLLVITFCS